MIDYSPFGEEYQPKWTYIFLIVSTIVYIFQQITPLWVFLAYTPAYTLRYPWTLLTAIFLHLDLAHFLFNMVALLIFGTILEKRIGNQNFFGLFLVSGIIGNIGYFVTSVNPMIPALGASGAIYGIIGALAILEPYRRVYLYGFMPLPMVGAAILWALGDLKGLFVPSRIAHGAHLGGMVIGIIAGILLKKQEKL